MDLPLREPNDYYQTPEECTVKLLSVESFHKKIWEPACGAGAISKVLERNGHEVVSTDLVNECYGLGGMDFLWYEDKEADTIITNPPFKLADEFVIHALIKLNVKKVVIFQRTAFLEGQARYQRLYRTHPPIRIWQLSKRYTLWREDDPNKKDTGGTLAFSWFVFENGNTKLPTLGWL